MRARPACSRTDDGLHRSPPAWEGKAGRAPRTTTADAEERTLHPTDQHPRHTPGGTESPAPAATGPSGLAAVSSAGTAAERPWARPACAAAGAVAVLVTLLTDIGTGVDLRRSVVGVLAVAAVSAVPVLRLWWPRQMVIASVVAAAALYAVTGAVGAAALLLAVALYTVTRRQPVRVLVATTAATGAVVVLVLGVGDGRWAHAFSALLIIGIAAAAADSSRVRAAYIHAIHERFRRLEETRELYERRRVVEERLRIARDLHDALAHQVAVINLHSGAASRALRERPEDAERSLTTIHQAARTVLDEMGEILSVLRGPEEQAGGRDPVGRAAGTLDDLDDLVDQFARTGLRVRAESTGDPTTPVPDAVSVVAYRVVHEGLTNAHKHGGGGTATLSVTTGDGLLTVEVTNPVDPARTPAGLLGSAPTVSLGSGHGLTGVRERVAACGGTVTSAHVDDGTFRLVVRLPVAPTDHDPTVDHPDRGEAAR